MISFTSLTLVGRLLYCRMCYSHRSRICDMWLCSFFNFKDFKKPVP